MSCWTPCQSADSKWRAERRVIRRKPERYCSKPHLTRIAPLRAMRPSAPFMSRGRIRQGGRRSGRSAPGPWRDSPRRSSGSATTRPPRTVAPTTIPAAISTTFLMMYCPSSVGSVRDPREDLLGKEEDGRQRPGHLDEAGGGGPPEAGCPPGGRARSRTPRRRGRGARPSGGTSPNVRTEIVRVARPWAGLRSGKSFSAAEPEEDDAEADPQEEKAAGGPWPS